MKAKMLIPILASLALLSSCAVKVDITKLNNEPQKEESAETSTENNTEEAPTE